MSHAERAIGHALAVEIATTIEPHDMEDLCEATNAAIIEGGGIGWVDAQNVPGGQGQDFTLNWYGQLGIARVLNEAWSVRASAMFQHHSNGGATNPNPGLDSLGVLIGVSRSF